MDNNLTVLYEDNQIIVVVKPQNVPTQADSSGDKDLLTMIKEYVKEKYDKPGEVYIGLVHRLDRPTGGVMVFARTSKAAARLQEQMKTGLFEKKYLAVTVGVPRDNLALWAYELRFYHPVNKNPFVFKVFPPTDEVPWNVFPVESHIKVARPSI